MIKAIRINSYRNLEGVKLENLGLMNVIVGENNTGKTSLLESINLIKDENVLKNLIDGTRWREYRIVYPREIRRNYEMYHSVLNSFDLRQGINKYLSVDFETDFGEYSVGMKGTEFEDVIYPENIPQYMLVKGAAYLGEDNLNFNGLDGVYWYNEITTAMEFTEMTPYRLKKAKAGVAIPVEYISPVTYYLESMNYKKLSQVIKDGNKDLLLDLLQGFDNNIYDLNIILDGNKPKVYLSNSKLEMVPLSLFGDGVKKALTVAASIICNRHGIILIDEIEIGIHKKALVNFFRWIMAAGKMCDTQIFATTHSIEAIDALLETVDEDMETDEIVAYRLETDKKHIVVKRFSQSKLMRLRNELGYDFR